MPEKETIQRAEKDKSEGKSPSTQAGEFVREEMHHVREGKHGARSTKQAIAIGLSKARAGVKLPPGKSLEANPFGLAVVVVHGPAKGESDKLRQMTEGRAMAIRSYLVTTFKVDDSRIRIMGLGKAGDESQESRGDCSVSAQGESAAYGSQAHTRGTLKSDARTLGLRRRPPEAGIAPVSFRSAPASGYKQFGRGPARVMGGGEVWVHMKAVAIILIAGGIGIMIWGAFGFKTREKVIDAGPLHVWQDKTHYVPYGPVVGAVLALGGLALLLKGKS